MPCMLLLVSDTLPEYRGLLSSCLVCAEVDNGSCDFDHQ